MLSIYDGLGCSTLADSWWAGKLIRLKGALFLSNGFTPEAMEHCSGHAAAGFDQCFSCLVQWLLQLIGSL